MFDPVSNKTNMMSNYILSVLFIIAIFLPVLDLIFHLDPTKELTEKRRLAEFPEIKMDRSAIEGFPKRFEEYYNDNFGFRKLLIRLNILSKVYILGSLTNSRVIMGKRDWLFYSGGSTIDYYRSNKPFNDDQLANWLTALEERRRWLSKKGIRYLFIAVPIKHTVYPEFLPDSINRVREKTRLDQLIEYSKKNSDLQILDLRPVLISSKGKRRLYHKTDTHWNEIGAFVSYEEIIKYISRFFPGIKPHPISSFKIQKKNMPGRDLAAMMGIQDILYEDSFKLVPRFPIKQHPTQMIGIGFLVREVSRFFDIDFQIKEKSEITGIKVLNDLCERDQYILSIPDLNLYMAIENRDSSLPRAVMFHDSFTVMSLFYFMSYNFRRIVYLWRDNSNPMNAFETSVIERECPDIVIQEMCERILMKDPPSNPTKVRRVSYR